MEGLNYDFLKTNLDIDNNLGWWEGEDILPYNVWMEEGMYLDGVVSPPSSNAWLDILKREKVVSDTDKIIKEIMK